MGLRHYLLIASTFVAACGDASAPVGPANITVRNRSQFELLDLRFHSEPSWAASENLLAVPLGVDGELGLVFDNGQYVTAMRRKVEVGDVIAISSAAPLPAMADGDVLVVFDLSFRVEAAAPTEPPPIEPPEEQPGEPAAPEPPPSLNIRRPPPFPRG